MKLFYQMKYKLLEPNKRQVARFRNAVNLLKQRRRTIISNEYFGTVPDDYNQMLLSYSEWTLPFQNQKNPNKTKYSYNIS